VKKNSKLNYFWKKLREKNLSLILDPKVNGYEISHLRSIPFIISLDYDNITYPNSWYQNVKNLKFEDYSYFHAENYNDISNKFAVFTNQEIEETYYSLSKLINYSVKNGIPSLYVVDKKDFRFRGELRPFVEEDEIKRSNVIEYSKLYKSFKKSLEETFNFRIKSKNVSFYFLESAAMMSFIDGKKIFKDSKDIIDEMIDSPYLPIWKKLQKFNPSNNNQEISLKSLIKSIKFQLDLEEDTCTYMIDKIEIKGEGLINKGYRQSRLIPTFNKKIKKLINYINEINEPELKNILLRKTNQKFFEDVLR